MSIQLQGNSDSVFSNDVIAPNIPTQGQIVGYQQGEWIVTPTEGTVTSYGSQWTRIGNLVTLRANVRGFTDTSSAVDIGITGVPYARNDLFVVGPVRSSNLNYGPNNTPNASLNAGDVIRISVASPTIGGDTLPVTGYVLFSNFITAQQQNTQLVFTLTYQTDDTTWTPINGATLS